MSGRTEQGDRHANRAVMTEVGVQRRWRHSRRRRARVRACPSAPSRCRAARPRIADDAYVADELELLEAKRDGCFSRHRARLPYRRATQPASGDAPPSRPASAVFWTSWRPPWTPSRGCAGRGIRVAPGGDYGLCWNPHAASAGDLLLFVDVLGLTPMEVIAATIRLGGDIARRPDELRQLKPGYLADLLRRRPPPGIPKRQQHTASATP